MVTLPVGILHGFKAEFVDLHTGKEQKTHIYFVITWTVYVCVMPTKYV